MCCDETARDTTVCPVMLLCKWVPYSLGNVFFELTTKSQLKVDVLVICQTFEVPDSNLGWNSNNS
jgi:hypothetical protein